MEVRDLTWTRAGHRLLGVPALTLDGPGLFLLVGATGSGKSSLLKAFTGTLQEYHGGASSGTIQLIGNDGERDGRVGYVPQDPLDGFLAFDAQTEFELRLQAAHWPRTQAVAESKRRLAALHFDGKETVPITRLSGGERKRLAIAAAQLHDPHILLLDEALNHLDDAWRPLVLDDLLAAAETRIVIVAAHDVDHWLPLARQVVLMRGGTVAWQGGADAFAGERARFPEIREPVDDPYYPLPLYEGPAALTAHALTARRGRPLFRELDLELPVGLHAITGPNGAGKSTLLRILAGLERPDEGNVRYDYHDLHEMRPSQRAAFTTYHFENPGRLFFLPAARQELEFQPRNAGQTPLEAESNAYRAANAFGLEPYLDQHPTSLSGGEQERLALACLDAARPSLILLDEPTHGLDQAAWDQLIAFLERYRRHACILLATHEADLVRIADTHHHLDEGRLRTLRLGAQSNLVEVTRRTHS